MIIRFSSLMLLILASNSAFSMSVAQEKQSKAMITDAINKINAGGLRPSKMNSLYENAMAEAKKMQSLGISSKKLQGDLAQAYSSQLRARNYLGSSEAATKARIAKRSSNPAAAQKIDQVFISISNNYSQEAPFTGPKGWLGGDKYTFEQAIPAMILNDNKDIFKDFIHQQVTLLRSAQNALITISSQDMANNAAIEQDIDAIHDVIKNNYITPLLKAKGNDIALAKEAALKLLEANVSLLKAALNAGLKNTIGGPLVDKDAIATYESTVRKAINALR